VLGFFVGWKMGRGEQKLIKTTFHKKELFEKAGASLSIGHIRCWEDLRAQTHTSQGTQLLAQFILFDSPQGHDDDVTKGGGGHESGAHVFLCCLFCFLFVDWGFLYMFKCETVKLWRCVFLDAVERQKIRE
jgi:hypothetical protein